jgi:homoaconitase
MPPYPKLVRNLEQVRRVLGSDRALTLAEKILYARRTCSRLRTSLGYGGMREEEASVARPRAKSRCDNAEESLLTGTNNGRDVRGKANLKLKPDRVAMQEVADELGIWGHAGGGGLGG